MKSRWLVLSHVTFVIVLMMHHTHFNSRVAWMESTVVGFPKTKARLINAEPSIVQMITMMVLSSMHAPRVVDCVQINHVFNELRRHDLDSANLFVLRKGEISE